MGNSRIVVSDATPLNILVRTGLIEVLPKLYGRVYIPPAVAAELSHPRTPLIVSAWLVSAPAWLEIRQPTSVDKSVARDLGEQEAICLALELCADYILLDEKNARRSALRLNLNVVGTVGILELAARRSLLDLCDAFDRLRRTDFHVSDTIIEAALQRASDRTPKK